jgi:hypothetical protein
MEEFGKFEKDRKNLKNLKGTGRIRKIWRTGIIRKIRS